MKEHFNVEIFEAVDKRKGSRPLQMEGGVHYCAFVHDLEPTHPIKEIAFSSEKHGVTWRGKLGYTYKIGGIEGLDARLRQNVEKDVKIRYSKRIGSLDELKEFDMIVGADGHRSKIALLTNMMIHSRIVRLMTVLMTMIPVIMNIVEKQ